MDFSGVLNAVTIITTLIAGGLAALQRAVVTNLREANKDLRDRDADREKTILGLEKENAALQADLSALGRVVTGEAHLTALGHAIDEHHREARDQWAAATELGQSILDELHQIRLSGGNG